MIVTECLKHCGLTEGEGISFSIGEKGLHGIVCKNRTQKELFLDILTGSAQADEGQVYITIKDKEFPVCEAKKHIGYVPFRFSMYEDMTVFEILDFIGEAKGVPAVKRYPQIKEAMNVTGLSKYASRQVASLSEPVRRRVGFAQAVIGNPQVIVIDEPFLVMNEADKRETVDLLEMLGKRKPVILGSTDSDILPLCSDIWTLFEGELQHFTGDELATRIQETKRLILTLSSDFTPDIERIKAVDGVTEVYYSKESRQLDVRYVDRDVRAELLTLCSVISMEQKMMTPAQYFGVDEPLSEIKVTSDKRDRSKRKTKRKAGEGKR